MILKMGKNKPNICLSNLFIKKIKFNFVFNVNIYHNKSNNSIYVSFRILCFENN